MTVAAEERTYADIALVDLLDRLIGTGVVLAGDIVISMSGIDLVQISLRALITSVRREMTEAWEES
ncbi:MAG TPA: gas vesicle protein [Nocardioides sp.]|nr:gas vesicle protein [Nocardioides sp.]